jgi:hypothetical protein
MNPDNFFAAPYGDRQLITFVEDSVLDKTPPKWPDYLENPFKSLDFKNPFANWAMRAMGLTAENMSVTWGVTLAVGVYRLLAVHLPKEAKDPPGGILLIRKSWSPRFILPPRSSTRTCGIRRASCGATELHPNRRLSPLYI